MDAVAMGARSHLQFWDTDILKLAAGGPHLRYALLYEAQYTHALWTIAVH
jgi:hypothetical protein